MNFAPFPSYLKMCGMTLFGAKMKPKRIRNPLKNETVRAHLLPS